MLTKITNKLSYTGALIRFFAFLLCLTGGQILFELQSVGTYRKVWEPVEQSSFVRCTFFSLPTSLHPSESFHVKSHPFQAHTYFSWGSRTDPLHLSPKGPVNKFLHGEQQVAWAKCRRVVGVV